MAEIGWLDEKNPTYVANKRYFADFLDFQDDEENVYYKKIQKMLESGESRLLININDLRAFKPDVYPLQVNKILKSPMEYFPPAFAALADVISGIEGADNVVKPTRGEFRFTVGFYGSFGSHKVSPRGLLAQNLGTLMCVEGIVTKCSLVRPKVSSTVHYCEATNRYTDNVYHDGASLTGLVTSGAYPTKDESGNLLTTEYGLSNYVDHQMVIIQEMPEKSPAGQLPRSVDVVLDADLVDKCKPGDRVNIVGIYRGLCGVAQGVVTNVKPLLIANNVIPIGSSIIQTKQLTEVDIKNIRKISTRKDLLHLMANSIAPSIQGHEYIKRSLVLLLLGGVERNLPNGHHLRGDINLLMVGDPSTAKSQLLRFVLNIAPLAINTTGRGSSGVGLTAAVTTDEAGERRLEAGAMVLADRGIVCIDEFDKMGDADRVAIHEVMEQQTVTIAKAGMHMSLNARCSVVAAANPRGGAYDPTKNPAYNVHLPDSLISRFDLLFIVLDQPDPSLDRLISQRVLANHSYRGQREEVEAGADDDEATPVFQRFDKVLHARMGQAPVAGGADERPEILSLDFLKKYIQFAKATYEPTLSPQAAELIHEAYVQERSLPITARNLETIIRLSTAHAKLRLKKNVQPADVEAALSVLRYALENDTQVRKDEMPRPPAGGNSRDDNDDGDDDDAPSREQGAGSEPGSEPASVSQGAEELSSQAEAASQATQRPGNVRSKRRRDRPVGDEANLSQGSQSEEDDRGPSYLQRTGTGTVGQLAELKSPGTTRARTNKKAKASEAKAPATSSPSQHSPSFSEAMMTDFTKALASHFSRNRLLDCSLDAFLATGSVEATRAQAESMLVVLEDQNTVMFRDGVIHKI